MKIYIELSEKENELFNRISNKVGVDYEIKGNQIPFDSLICMIKDLNIELDNIQKKYENLLEDLEENYKPKTAKEIYS